MILKAVLTVVLSITLSHTAHAAPFKETSSHEHETVKARIVDPDPHNFTFSVRSLTNILVDDEAPTFAIYISSDTPETCADFSDIKLNYIKPTKYRRVFNLSGHGNILKALEKYQCIVVKNAAPE